MKKYFVIGGMGAGKSTAARALEALGLSSVDLDAVARTVLSDPEVRRELATTFGDDVLDASGAVRRQTLAERAFATTEATAALNRITQDRIAAAFHQTADELAAAGATAVVVEYPLFPEHRDRYVAAGDVVIAVVAPLEQRVARAVRAGFREDDVRRRIAAQIDDRQRLAAADVTFVNDGTTAELTELVTQWWRQTQAASNRSDRAATVGEQRDRESRVGR